MAEKGIVEKPLDKSSFAVKIGSKVYLVAFRYLDTVLFIYETASHTRSFVPLTAPLSVADDYLTCKSKTLRQWIIDHVEDFLKDNSLLEPYNENEDFAELEKQAKRSIELDLSWILGGGIL